MHRGMAGSLKPAIRAVEALVTSATAVSVSAEAGQQQNPDDPLTAATVAAEKAVSVSTAISTAVAASAAAAKEQKQDNPDPVVSTAACVLCASAAAGIVTTAVCSS